MKLVKAESETSSQLTAILNDICNSSCKTKKKHNLQWYSDLGTGSLRLSVTVEQYTYIFLYYDFTEKIATTWITQILHSSANTKIKCFKNINNK